MRVCLNCYFLNDAQAKFCVRCGQKIEWAVAPAPPPRAPPSLDDLEGLGRMSAIVTEGLTKRYGHITAVDNLNLQVAYKTVHGFLGPNGAGKTTTIKVLLGLLRPTSGRAWLLGKGVRWDDPSTRAKVGYVPELPRLPRHLTAYELLDIYGRMLGMAEQERREEIPKLLEMVGLRDRARDLIGKYSKGMQQRLGLAQAIFGDPELLILDEPSLGLDPVGMVEVREIVKRLGKEGKTIFLSSHLLHEVEQVCTHVTIINEGKALLTGALDEVVGGGSLEEVFMELVGRGPVTGDVR